MEEDFRALRAAIEDLDAVDRRVMAVAFARLRDELIADGDRRRAQFWGMLAALIANVSDEQEKLLAALEDDAVTPAGVVSMALELPGEQTGE